MPTCKSSLKILGMLHFLVSEQKVPVLARPKNFSREEECTTLTHVSHQTFFSFVNCLPRFKAGYTFSHFSSCGTIKFPPRSGAHSQDGWKIPTRVPPRAIVFHARARRGHRFTDFLPSTFICTCRRIALALLGSVLTLLSKAKLAHSLSAALARLRVLA